MSTVITNISQPRQDLILNPSLLGDDAFEALGGYLRAGESVTSYRPREAIMTIPDIRAAYAAGQISIETVADSGDMQELIVQPAVGGIGPIMGTSVSCPTSGATGTADDVTIFGASAPVPFDCQVFEAQLITTTAGAGGSTATLRTLAGGSLGSALSSAMTTAALGMATSTLSPPTVAKGSLMFLRRTDRSHVGLLKLWLLPV